jgi:glycosyltransferase involved in cell wall biosynthesis
MVAAPRGVAAVLNPSHSGGAAAARPSLRRERVVVVDNSRIFTGALSSILATCTALSDRYEFSFVLDSRSTVADEVRRRGFDVAVLPFLEVSRRWSVVAYLPVLVVNAARLARILDRRGASILHVNDLYNLVGVACRALRPKVRLVQHVRLLRSSYVRPAYPLFAWCVRRFADAVVCVSDAARRDLGGAGASIRRIYDALPPTERHPPKEYARRGGCRFVYVANYIRGKGHDLALEAFARVATADPDATLRFVGAGADGSLDPRFVRGLGRRVAELGLGGRIALDGPTADVEREMKDADVVVNLSESESFSMTCLEALAYGAPLVASACGGPSELVEHMENGILVPNGDPAAAAAALALLAGDAELAARLGRRGPPSVRRKFDASRTAAELASTYLDVLRS